MSCPNVLFVAKLESLETRRNNISRSFFQDICEPNFCFIILSHLRVIPVLPLGWDVPLPFQDPFYAPKNTVHLYILAYIITNQQSYS